MDERDFEGCSTSACRPRNKPWVHTYQWGFCEWAEKPEDKPPTLGRWEVYLAEDGENALHWVETPVETRTEYGYRTPDGTEFFHEAMNRTWALAAADSHPDAVPLRRRVYIGPTEEISNE